MSNSMATSLTGFSAGLSADALCNTCLVPIIENTTFYKCKFNGQGCNFVLHDRCTRLPAELYNCINHPQHTLLLLTKADHEFSRFYYIIQVRCAFIPKKIKHKSHPNHQLSRFAEASTIKDYCHMCFSRFTADNNISFGCDACEFHLHVGCALLLPETIRHRYDKHPLSLVHAPVENHEGDYFCEVCEEELNPNASFYHCHECAQSIHTTCAPMLIPQIKPYIYGTSNVRYRNIKCGGIHKTEYDQHPLSFLPGTKRDGDCTTCGKTLNDRHILKRLQCKFAIHYMCHN
ncbi:putative chromatin regulator PHD family [Helianthus anomalus]